MMKASAIAIVFISILCFLSLPSPAFSDAKCNPGDLKVIKKIKAFWGKYNANLNFVLFVYSCNRGTDRITDLGVLRGNISAPIPPAVAELPYLQTLDLHKLNLTGGIPPSIAKLRDLNYFRADWNKLSGPVPSFLSQLKKLNYLILSFNDFTGSIPPSLSQLPNLDAIYLDRNKLTGSIPESFGHWAGKTPDIYLSHNNLTGRVPESFWHLNFPTEIDLSRNKLEGDPSFLFGKNKTVQIIDLSRNMFEFDFSNVEIPVKLNSLDLNHNKIFGSLPQGLARPTLGFVNVSYNRLCGQIPQGGNLQDQIHEYSFLHNRCLCGAPLPIPCK